MIIYDVYVSDMKKLIKWFSFLNDAGKLSLEDDEPIVEENPTPEVVEAEAEVIVEEKPKKKAAKKKEA